MPLTEKQQMIFDTESATHTGMEVHPRSSQKYLLLQVWCGILTVAMVVMAALLISIKPKSTENEVSTLKPDKVSPTGTTGNTNVAPLTSTGSSSSYIQLIKALNGLWEVSPPTCPSCSLFLNGNSIQCNKTSMYFIYAQVTFLKHPQGSQDKRVILKRNPTDGRRMKKLVEGIFPNTTEGSVWVAGIVSLTAGESVSLDITGDFRTQTISTFWGAYQLH